MIDLAAICALVALTVYAVLGGADFGGGVWDLLASGPRARQQRELVERVIAPVWEVNHIWLIVVVVMLFGCFPPAYAALGTALHVPLTCVLFGIVLRGAAFAFRHYGDRSSGVQYRWGRVFAVASLLTPLFLGASLAAVTSGEIRVVGGQVTTPLTAGWTSGFALVVAGFVTALFAQVAAVFLTNETADRELQGDFRRRAIAAGLVAVALGSAGAGVAPGAFAARLTGEPWSVPLIATTALVAALLVWALLRGRYALARALVVAQVVLVILGWATAQYPFIIAPDITIQVAAAPPRTLELTLMALAGGAVVLIPALIWLLRIFRLRDPS